MTNDQKLLSSLVPVGVLMVAVPFADTNGPSSFLWKAIAQGAAYSSLSLFVLFVAIAIFRPVDWNPWKSINEIQVITYWLAAVIVISSAF